MLKFDEILLNTQLLTMPSTSKIAFSLCCATRQLNSYEEFAKRFLPNHVDAARNTIEKLWQSVVITMDSSVDWDDALSNIMALIPAEQSHWAPLHVYAEGALSSLAYTIRCLKDSSCQEAVWSARRAYEVADQAAIRALDAQVDLVASENEILTSPIVQQELQRQARDIISLEASPSKEKLKELQYRSLSETTLTLSEMHK